MAILIAQEITPALEAGVLLVNVLPEEALLRERLPGSSRLFAFLGKHVVNDHIHLHVKLHAKRP